MATARPAGRRLRIALIALACALLLPVLAAVILLAVAIPMPGESRSAPLDPLTPAERETASRLERHVLELSREIGERNARRCFPELEDAAAYVDREISSAGWTTESQQFDSGRVEVENVVASRPGGKLPGEIVVVGAHYDSAEGTPGADDNASAVALLIELAHALSATTLDRTLRLVAFVNEEPPYFQTDTMGSLVYARSCRDAGDEVVAMISLECLGYYSDAPGSQHYPAPLSWFYPDTGDFVGFVGNVGSRALVRRSVASFREKGVLPSEGIAAPSWIPGIGYSDHWAFWEAGYPAVMVTDTAFFRNSTYHLDGDLPDTLDYERMARLVTGLAALVTDLASEDAR